MYLEISSDTKIAASSPSVPTPSSSSQSPHPTFRGNLVRLRGYGK